MELLGSALVVPLELSDRGPCRALVWAQVLSKPEWSFLKHTKDGVYSCSLLKESKQALLWELVFALLKERQEAQVCGWVILEKCQLTATCAAHSDSHQLS